MGYYEGVAILCGINLIAVLGLSVLTGFTGLFSFGHAGFMAIGAYASAIVTRRFGLPFPLAIAAAGAAAAAVSWAIGRLTLKLKGDYFCIATMGFGEATRLVFSNWAWVGGGRGWESIPMYTTLPVVLVLDLVFVVLAWNLVNSRQGRNMVAVREEELAAQMVGVDVFRYKMTALVVSAVFVAVAGALMAHYMTYIRPKSFDMVKSTELTIMVIFGGLGSISGSILGTLLLTSLPELLRNFAQWRLVVYGLAVIIIMVGRPQGLLGGMEVTPKGIRKALAARRARRSLAAATAADEKGDAP